MTNKFELTLDLSKKNSNLNSPVIIRQGDSKEGTTIEATILDHGMTYSALSEASFYCTKPDNTVVLGDPATVNGNIITYNVNTQVGACSGNIERAFFSLNNGLVSTGNFEIIVLYCQVRTLAESQAIIYQPCNSYKMTGRKSWMTLSLKYSIWTCPAS